MEGKEKGEEVKGGERRGGEGIGRMLMHDLFA